VTGTVDNETRARHLRIYINDHRAGAAAGLSLARRCLQNNRDTEFAADLASVVAEIAEDADALRDIARRLDIADDPLKRLTARFGEIVGRLKFNGHLTHYSPLSRVLELEMLLAGIDAKRSLWRSLATAGLPELASIDFDTLEERATQQRSLLLRDHAVAAQRALSVS
jgi:hypothetical protein